MDLRQEELAERINCSAVTIRKIEAGGRRPSRQIAELLADYFQVPPDERTAFVQFARQVPSTPTRLSENTLSQAPWRVLYNQLSNIPSEPTDLIGRQQELQAVSDLVRRDSIRLVTLTGPPGIGKTRLSLQLATDLFADFEDGVCFVGLARIGQAAQVAGAIADTLGVRETADQALALSLRQALQDKRQLLVLDNFEHVLAAAPLVAELLATCRWLKVLVTSRAALHVRGEHQFLVPPLALPDLTRPAVAEAISSIPSVTLFVSRAQAVNRDFTLTDENAVTVAAICTRLEGLPLAIELAAARLNVFTAHDLQARLEDRFALLQNGALDLPERHQTLRNAIAWSYDLLNTSEQTLFSRMAVFANGATLDAVEAIVNATGDRAGLYRVAARQESVTAPTASRRGD
jgi:predicted ATPase/DNA-binding XRE family transcriptional regulator